MYYFYYYYYYFELLWKAWNLPFTIWTYSSLMLALLITRQPCNACAETAWKQSRDWWHIWISIPKIYREVSFVIIQDFRLCIFHSRLLFCDVFLIGHALIYLETLSLVMIIIIKSLFTVGYNVIVYPRSGKLIHTNYLQRYNILAKNNMTQLIT